MLGTLKNVASSGTVIQKIKVIPIELRRPSYLRGSGHTFEYLGYGPGNYSTAVPQKQTRKLSDDDVLVSQSREISGGTVVYSGMNDLGEFYSGSKKLNSASGQETVIEAPILTFTGDDVDGTSDPTKLAGIFDEVLISQRLTVEGGDGGTESSIFYGPVRFQKGLNITGELSAATLRLNNISASSALFILFNDSVISNKLQASSNTKWNKSSSSTSKILSIILFLFLILFLVLIFQHSF
jgi:hypothetical protein